MAAVTQRTIRCCCTRPATDKSITPWVRRVCRPLSQGGSERLEPDIWKWICPVLRGGVDGNAAPLLDTMKLTILERLAIAYLVHLEHNARYETLFSRPP